MYVEHIKFWTQWNILLEEMGDDEKEKLAPDVLLTYSLILKIAVKTDQYKEICIN